MSALIRRLDLLWRAADEFTLTTVLLFVAVTVIRWLRNPGSPLFIADLSTALVVIGVISGVVLTGLIVTPIGRRCGGHMNPAVTVSLWLMGSFPGRRVVPYVLAQIAGSVAGAGLAVLAWGSAATHPMVAVGAIRPAATWEPVAVFAAEFGAMAAIVVTFGFFLVRHGLARLVPYVIGLSVGLVIAVLGPLSGGSINPARQLGPALLAGQTTDLWIYLVAPVLGAVAGTLIHRYIVRRSRRRRLTHRVTPARPWVAEKVHS
jgi:glycerol uptake facilitator protein/aquaporin Z